MTWTSTIARLTRQRQTAFIGATAVRHAGGVLLAVLVLFRLTPSDFARYGLLASAIALAVPLLTLNIHVAPTRLYFDHASDKDRADLLRSCLFASHIIAIILLVGAGAASSVFGGTDPVTLGNSVARVLFGFAVVCAITLQFGYAVFRVRPMPRAFLGLSALYALGVPAVFLIAHEMGIDGVTALLWSYAVTGAVGAAFVLLLVIPAIRGGTLVRLRIREALRFSWPTTVHLVAFWAITSSGRWIGIRFLPLDDLASYTLLTQVILLTGGYSRALYDAHVPEIAGPFAAGAEAVGRGVVNRVLRQTVVLVTAIYLALAVVIWGFSGSLPPAYRISFYLLGLAYASSILDAAYLRGIQILQHSKRTKTLALATVSSGIVTVTASWILANRAGEEGLLAALVLGMGVQAAVMNVTARQSVR